MCGSYAINPNMHGRELGKDLDLCDVCYWRVRADQEFSIQNKQSQKRKSKSIFIDKVCCDNCNRPERSRGGTYCGKCRSDDYIMFNEG